MPCCWAFVVPNLACAHGLQPCTLPSETPCRKPPCPSLLLASCTCSQTLTAYIIKFPPIPNPTTPPDGTTDQNPPAASDRRPRPEVPAMPKLLRIGASGDETRTLPGRDIPIYRPVFVPPMQTLPERPGTASRSFEMPTETPYPPRSR
jgi:hypothetical protein